MGLPTWLVVLVLIALLCPLLILLIAVLAHLIELLPHLHTSTAGRMTGDQAELGDVPH